MMIPSEISITYNLLSLNSFKSKINNLRETRGEPIPEDVQIELDYNLISKEITDTEAIIRILRIKEKNILKILKKLA